MSTWKYSRGINRWEETIVFLSISKGERDWSDGDRVQHLWLPWRRWRTALGPAGVGTPVELHFRRHHLKGSTDVIHINSEESKDRA